MLKTFDLQAALAGAKVITRDGRQVKIAGYNPDALGDCQLLGWSGIYYSSWYSDGKSEFGKENDLFMVPTERKEWVVVYRDKYGNAINSIVCNSEPNPIHYRDSTIHEITIIE